MRGLMDGNGSRFAERVTRSTKGTRAKSGNVKCPANKVRTQRNKAVQSNDRRRSVSQFRVNDITFETDFDAALYIVLKSKELSLCSFFELALEEQRRLAERDWKLALLKDMSLNEHHRLQMKLKNEDYDDLDDDDAIDDDIEDLEYDDARVTASHLRRSNHSPAQSATPYKPPDVSSPLPPEDPEEYSSVGSNTDRRSMSSNKRKIARKMKFRRRELADDHDDHQLPERKTHLNEDDDLPAHVKPDPIYNGDDSLTADDESTLSEDELPTRPQTRKRVLVRRAHLPRIINGRGDEDDDEEDERDNFDDLLTNTNESTMDERNSASPPAPAPVNVPLSPSVPIKKKRIAKRIESSVAESNVSTNEAVPHRAEGKKSGVNNTANSATPTPPVSSNGGTHSTRSATWHKEEHADDAASTPASGSKGGLPPSVSGAGLIQAMRKLKPESEGNKICRHCGSTAGEWSKDGAILFLCQADTCPSKEQSALERIVGWSTLPNKASPPNTTGGRANTSANTSSSPPPIATPSTNTNASNGSSSMVATSGAIMSPGGSTSPPSATPAASAAIPPSDHLANGASITGGSEAGIPTTAEPVRSENST